MARALEEQWTLPASHSLSFDERLGLLLDRELAWRDNQRLVRLRKKAKLKYANACLEDLDRRPGRGLDERLIASLAGGDWIRQQHNLLLTGATGAGKTWLACALGNQACRQGYSTLYLRTPRLLEQLRIAHGDGSFGRTLQQLAKVDVLVLDDWALAPLEEGARHDLLEVIDDRAGNRSTILASQLPIEHWHGWINDPTLADAILDRLVHSAYRLTLKGESLRRKKLRSKPHRDRCDYNPQPAQPGRKHRSRISETLGHVHRNPHWLRLVYLANPARVDEMGTRLASVVQTAWQELSLQPTAKHIQFHLYHKEEEGQDRALALLVLSIVEPSDEPSYLRIELQEESLPGNPDTE